MIQRTAQSDGEAGRRDENPCEEDFQIRGVSPKVRTRGGKGFCSLYNFYIFYDFYKKPSRRMCGFTLIELLVVIAIISLLVSILLPSLQKAREIAKQTACISNVRNMGVAVHLYAGDFEGYKPAPRRDDEYAGLWFFTLGRGRDNKRDDLNYLPYPRRYINETEPDKSDPGKENFWRCPSYSSFGPSAPNTFITYGMSRSHGYGLPFRFDYTTTSQGHELDTGKLARNSSAVFIFGCGCLQSSRILFRLSALRTEYQLDKVFYVWHDSGSPFVCLDGHVEIKDFEYLYDARDNSPPSGNFDYDSFWGHLY